ncbi:ABC transporter substrate-binding protein [Lapillicoccus sp.]|uniref:ABC transporter substrate-binding protein n=1 Tax=Lapillicoccus sp. TaxID=1909287 RepID=UPI0025EA296E|nr:ABC transporter substrate-binding protein [Lapillicoccus sp.]
MNSFHYRVTAVTAVALAAVGLAACSSSSGGSSGAGSAAAGSTTKVTLQLQWVTQAQFGGYIAALAKGYYAQQGLDVKIVPAGTDTVPQTTVADGGSADFAIAWVPKALQSREKGAGITDVGQVFQRSGTLQVSFKGKDITSAAALKGKTVGDWGFGNEYELFAAMTKAGIDPGKDVKIVQQQFDMNALLQGDIDAAQAMVYNEYAQVLEAKNPATGNLYQPSDFNAINWNDAGTAMLQDAIWANTTKLKDPAFQDTTVKFLTASYQGWIFCSTNPSECRDDVVKAGSKLGASHQLWQMNEVNKLVWPSPDGIGTVDKAAWDRTVTVASSTKNSQGATVLTKAPDSAAYTNDYTVKALAKLKAMGLDTTGAGFKPTTVTLNPGGS